MESEGTSVLTFLFFWSIVFAASVYLFAQEKIRMRSETFEQLELSRRDPETGPRTVLTPPNESSTNTAAVE